MTSESHGRRLGWQPVTRASSGTVWLGDLGLILGPPFPPARQGQGEGTTGMGGSSRALKSSSSELRPELQPQGCS